MTINKAASELGKLGGAAVKKKYGRDHFVRAVNVRWKKWREAHNLSPEEVVQTDVKD